MEVVASIWTDILWWIGLAFLVGIGIWGGVLALAQLGLVVFGPPTLAFHWIRRARRILRAVDRDFDRDGYRVYLDDDGNTYYRMDYSGTRGYVVYAVGRRRVCAYVSENGEVIYRDREGRHLRRLPRALRNEPLEPDDLPADAVQNYDVLR